MKWRWHCGSDVPICACAILFVQCAGAVSAHRDDDVASSAGVFGRARDARQSPPRERLSGDFLVALAVVSVVRFFRLWAVLAVYRRGSCTLRVVTTRLSRILAQDRWQCHKRHRRHHSRYGRRSMCVACPLSVVRKTCVAFMATGTTPPA